MLAQSASATAATKLAWVQSRGLNYDNASLASKPVESHAVLRATSISSPEPATGVQWPSLRQRAYSAIESKSCGHGRKLATNHGSNTSSLTAPLLMASLAAERPPSMVYRS